MKYNAFPILLASTFLSTSAIAQTIPEINADYLNSLTGDKVTWEDASASEMGAMEIAGKYYKATYHNIDNYEEIKDKSENISVVDPTDNWTNKYVGAAINNVSGNNYGNIDKKVFLNNKVTANLENNTGYSRTLNVYGGAISNQGEIGDIIADFIGNSVEATKSGSNANAYAYGGAIYNGVIDDNIASISYVTGDFIGNYAEGYGASGGAISNYAHSSSTSKVIPIVTIGNIFGNFIKNHATKNGGAISNYAYSASGSEAATASINNIVGVFAENYATNGGAISNLPASVAHITLSTTNIGSIKGDFIGNHATANGGAISNNSSSYKKERAKIGNITGSFIKNYVISNAVATGGAIRNDGVIDNIIGNFFCNYIETTNIIPPYAPMIRGGAIYTSTDLTLSSDNDAHYFDGNYTLDRRGKIYNAIFIGSNSNSTSSITITFNTFNVSSWVINDNIEGLYKYNLSFTGNDTIDTELGTTTQYINMNNAIINAGEVKVENTTLRFGNYQHEDKTAKNWDGKGKFIASLNYDGTENIDADSVTSLTLNNAVFDISNGYLETIKLKKLTSTENTSNFIHLDVNVENMESDIINVKGDVDGGTKLIIHATSDKDIRGRGKILFAESFGDTKGGETSFEVARVYKSPYLYDVIYEGVKNTSTPT
ncbi:MAG: hypothetical protein J6K16_07730, partial [Alphaproteobacteria bacterium]|nr:hypothetical protein [Alphaproteobacteria bacterium]